MSRGLNRIQLIGRLGRDPEMRYTSSGKAVTNFSIAVGGRWTDRDGNERDDTEWFQVDAWDRLAEISNEYLSKGSQVYIEGRVRSRKYTDRDGIERTAITVIANDLVLLSGRNDNAGSGSGSYERGGGDEDMAYNDEAPARQAPPPPARQAAPARQQAAPAARGQAQAAPRRNQPQPIEQDMGDEEIPF